MADEFEGEYGTPPPGYEYEEEDVELSADYRSTAICKALGIKRERLKDWIKADFIRPTVPALGQGTKAGFTKGDVYAIALFIKLLGMGFKRDFAAQLIEPVIGKAGNEIFFSRYLILTIESKGADAEETIKPHFQWGGSMECKLEFTPSTLASTTDNVGLTDWDGTFVFNLVKLSATVDKALKDIES
ncbi:MerR family transcriptional regulator [Desulfogranum marinum]|uniref:MerR family transcriptional regulator n=1 Tax=Desulfogranum marinum TaxID=453220 RepID=UPI001964B2F0|nr:MerR family transcriptional regulator [Desulfogranum marinum]MBM9514715.1 MerR family transcriptional regulator [Desulfogranum marinum]